MKTIFWWDICTPMFIAVLFTIAKIWKQPKYPSTEEWIKKMWYVYIYIYTHTRIYNGILFIHEKGEYHAICKNMDGPWAYYAKWNKSDRERKVLYDITYMWNLKNPKPIKNWE